MNKVVNKVIVAVILGTLVGCASNKHNFQDNNHLPDKTLLERNIKVTCFEFKIRPITLKEITQRSRQNFYEEVISQIPAYNNSISSEDIWIQSGNEIRYIPYVIDKNFEKRKYENVEIYYQEELRGYIFLEMIFKIDSDQLYFDRFYMVPQTNINSPLPGSACGLWMKDYEKEFGSNAIKDFGIVDDRQKCLKEVRRLLRISY